MIVNVPAYKMAEVASEVKVEILVLSAGRNSEPVEFYYRPGILSFQMTTIALLCLQTS